jgi:hypothetical protein
MDNLKNIITGGIITLFIGGSAYTFSQQDVVDNFATDTGLTQEQAEQYVNSVPEEELIPFDEVGSGYVDESEKTLSTKDEIDCVNYEYEWETPTLTCAVAKSQLQKIATSELSVGRSFIKLSSENATEDDIRTAISHLDQLNINYDLEINKAMFDEQSLEEMKKTNSYNKALLQSALESN